MSIYELFAVVLTYPGEDEDYAARVRECLQAAPAESAAVLAEFAERVASMSTAQAQEMYTSAFDLNPSCALELGWHLFGEKYERGLLLVRMRQELRRHGIAETTELPDHLTHALRLLDRMEHEPAEDFTGAIVLPAIQKLLAAMKQSSNPYEHVLCALELFLRSTFPDLEIELPVQQLPVLQGVNL
jgi:nitrate reductase molybdenum cofactor assembly chaperone NarJ/NarW